MIYSKKRRSRCVHISAAKEFSTWMSDLPEGTKKLPLSELCIPGSHDSCTSSLVPGSVAGVDQPKVIRDLAARFPRAAKYLLSRWSYTQHMDVSDQLNSGIRYFDIRCVADSPGETIRVIHCLLGDPVFQILTKISKFLQQNKGEVVILDFQHLFNFICVDHARLCQDLVDLFGCKLCPVPPAGDSMYSLEFLVQSGFQVIVIYPFQMANFCWRRDLCPNPWPNTTSTRYLKEYLTEKTNSRDKSTLFVSQGVLTPRLSTILLNVTSDLEHACAAPCNSAVLDWLTTQDTRPNIVITDFVMCSKISHDIIHILVKSNFR